MTLSLGKRTKIGEACHGKKAGRPLYRYEVVRGDGVVVGYVEQHEVMRSRMAGRLRVRDFYPLRWSWQPAGQTTSGHAVYHTLADAARALLEWHLSGRCGTAVLSPLGTAHECECENGRRR